MQVTFGICADIHTEFVHDSVERMEKFLAVCHEKTVDFCISLGDFCPPGEMNHAHKEKILAMLRNDSLPFHHVLGNHDMDRNSKENVLSYLGQSEPHFSFDCGGVHFILLDACHFWDNGEYFPYHYGNYTKGSASAKVPMLPPSELEWLREDLKKAEYPSVIFTHQSLIESRAGIKNAEEFRAVIKEAPNKVLLCVCGHEHVDRAEQKDGVWYFCLNSMSYYWAGHEYEHSTYGEEIERDYPLLRQVFPYKDPLFAMITVSEDAITIQGTKSEIVGKAPHELDFQKPGLCDPITASVEDRVLPL